MSDNYISIINTKFFPPRVGNTPLKRSRILSHLNKNNNKSYTVVIGPAGYGKSILMTQLLEEVSSRNEKAIWLNLDESDDVPTQFLSCLLEAFKRVDQELSFHIARFEESNGLSNGKRVITSLINFLSNTDDLYHFFIEDYHCIENDIINEYMRFFLINSPGNIKFCISSRISPQLSLTRLQYRDQVVFVGIDLLAFDINEVSEFFLTRNALHTTLHESEMLRQKTGGWPATLQLISERLKYNGNDIEFIKNFNGLNSIMTEFMSSEVFSHLEEDTLSFLLDISIVERFCFSLCTAITGNVNPREVIESPVSGSFLLQSFDVGESWYKFHPLVRHFLVSQLQGDERIKGLHFKASEWFGENNYTLESITHALAAGDDKRSLSLLEEKSMVLMEQGFIDVLINLVKKLPQGEFINCEKVLIALAWAQLLSHRFVEFKYLLSHVKEVVEPAKGHKGESLRAQHACLTAVMYMYEDDPKNCGTVLHKWIDTVPENLVLEKALMANVLSHYNMSTYKFDEVMSGQQRAAPYQDKLKNSGAKVFGLIISGLTKMQQARFSDAESLFCEAESLSYKKPGRVSDFKRLANLLRATIEYYSGNISVAEQLLESNAEALRQYAFIDILIEVLPVLTRVHQAAGDWQKAQRVLELTQYLADERNLPRLKSFLLHEHVRFLLQGGDVEGASRKLVQWDNTYGSLFDERFTEWVILAKVRFLIATEEFKSAETYLLVLIKNYEKDNRSFRQLQALVLLIRARFLSGQFEAAVDTFKTALDQDCDHRITQIFVDEFEAMDSFLQQFLALQENKSFMPSFEMDQCRVILKSLPINRRVVNEHNLVLGRCESGETLQEPLTRREEGVLQLVAEGLSNREISEKLSLSVETIKSHLKSIFSKFDVSRRTRAVNKARKLGLIK